MKTLVAKFSGTTTPGDLVILSYASPRGGRSDAKYLVIPGDSIQGIVGKLVESINSEKGEWCPGAGEFKATQKDETLYVQCSDRVSNVKFSYDVTGAQTERIELRELGGAA